MLRNRLFGAAVILASMSVVIACDSSSHNEMKKLLEEQRKKYNHRDNYYASGVQAAYYDSLINATNSAQDKMFLTYNKCYALIASGREDEAIPLLKEQVDIINREGIQGMNRLKVQLALAYLRSGERTNCIANHTGETCIMPIQGTGVHKNQEGSRKAAGLYKELLDAYPDNMEYRWLLNIAYMTLGEYPEKVPARFRLPNLAAEVDTTANILPFKDVASGTKLDINDMAGGVIVDDFDNDGYLDIVTSSWDLDVEMHFFKNNADGTFVDKSEESNLKDLRGGLNLMQMDFNNDGWKDIFVLRGAWLRGIYGLQPNSLIRNNGNGTFTDVTTTSGMLSFHPTQTATWNDFNNDGWVDVFIGNESWEGNRVSGEHPCELYLNKQDGTFVEVARKANVGIVGFIKGVTSADYNRDGWKDIFISSLSGERYLLKNKGLNDHDVPSFEDVTHAAGLDDVAGRTFPTWFWDYNNDGGFDILVGDFTFDKPIATFYAEQSNGNFNGTSGTMILYRNNNDGTFKNVSEEVGLDRPAFAMSGNFGDIDNDGFLDFYLGTGNPELESIVPNKMFKNNEGQKFLDVTTTARVGHLQKGHAIAFGDIDNDGDQDIYCDLGGAYKGDSFHSAFYLNPGTKSNHWIALDLIAKDNNSIIGTSISLVFKDKGQQRMIYMDVNSGGSFGASPLRKQIGLGSATVIDELSIHWHPGEDRQTFRKVPVDRCLRILQGVNDTETLDLRVLNFERIGHSHH